MSYFVLPDQKRGLGSGVGVEADEGGEGGAADGAEFGVVVAAHTALVGGAVEAFE